MRNLCFSPPTSPYPSSSKRNNRIFSLAWNIVYWLLEDPCGEFSGMENTVIFEPKKLMEIWYILIIGKVLVLNFSGMENLVFFWDKKLMERWYLLITKKSLFLTLRGWETRSFLRQKLMGRWYLLVTETFLSWAFLWWKTRSFLRQKVNRKMILTDYWKVLVFGHRKSSCFELFGNEKYSLFFSKKVDVKVIFTWHFWVFHNIAGPGKYCFSCSATPLNSHSFTSCHTVSLLFSRPHGRSFISRGFTNFKWIFSQTHSFLRKQTEVTQSPVRKIS